MSIAQERYIERNACLEIRKAYPNVDCLKCRELGYPDRQIMLGKGRHIWIEFKTPIGKLSPRQLARHQYLRSKGDTVHVCTSKREALAAVAQAFRS